MNIVIVNHNTAGHLAACLESLVAGGMDGVAADVWVVDNASNDGSADLVRQRFPWARLIESPDNVGFSAANNLALRAAGYPERPTPREAAPERAALLLNPDTIVPRGALAALAAVLEEEPEVGVVGPQLVLSDGSLDLACRRAFPTPVVAFYRFSGLSRLFPRSPRFARYNMTFLDRDEPADVDSVVGACMLVRGAAIADTGLLDERFWMYGEDLDWALRIHTAGWRVVYRPHVVIHHVKRAASRGSRRAAFEFQRAMWLFYDKHYAATTPRWVHALVMLGLAARGGPRLLREMRSGSDASEAMT
jgi:GT2 family glycosyltransferase